MEDKNVAESVCHVCDRKFHNKVFLKKHSQIHSETRETFHCPNEFCPRWFYFKSNLTQHIRSFHEGKKYLCSQSGCSNKFTTKQKLLEHLKTVHQEGYNKVVKPRKPPKKRKDKGSFKTPMASVLTGVDCGGAKSLLTDERRPLDRIETICEEVGDFINNTSEASTSDAETFVGCRRGGTGGVTGFEPNLIIGNLKRPEVGRHFNKVKLVETDFSSDTDCDNDQAAIKQSNNVVTKFDFSKFVRK